MAGKLKMTVGKTVPLPKARVLITNLEQDRRIGGKGLIVMD
ncbi:hypothetical protein [Ralstonia syzygii]